MIPTVATLLETSFDLDTIGQILTIFVIADSLLSLVITYVMQRQALLRWRKVINFTLILLWAAVGLPLFELLLGTPPFHIDVFEKILNNPLVKLAIGSWLVGIVILFIIAQKIFTLDFIKFNKSKLLKFEKNKPRKWGLKSINEILAQERDQEIYFPIIVYGDEYSRPWRILQRFFVAGLTYQLTNSENSAGGIYFTFTRPAHEIKDALYRTYTILKGEKTSNPDIIGEKQLNWKNVVIIDCYTKLAEKYAEKKNLHLPCKIIYADPNNPHDMNKKYEEAIKLLRKNCCMNIRVVYDAISDFLKFTDRQLASQYLRHNMGYEFRENLESLYLFKSGTLPKEDEEYFLWFANGDFRILRKIPEENDDKKDYLQVDFRGPFKHAKRFKLDFDYKVPG